MSWGSDTLLDVTESSDVSETVVLLGVVYTRELKPEEWEVLTFLFKEKEYLMGQSP